jgi:hypothetical protein
MPFLSSLAYFGEVEVKPENPAVLNNVDCVYTPFPRDVFFADDPSWGVYTTDGSLILEASYRRGPELQLIGQSPARDLSGRSLDVEQAEHIYFGALIPHYGHFLVGSLARAWFAAQPDNVDRPLLCHSDHAIHDHFRGYMGVLTSALGLKPERFVAPTNEVRFRNLTIPAPAFLEQKLAHQAFLPPMRRIGDALGKGAPLESEPRPVWLSKSRMGINSVAHIANEAELEEVLVSFGFDIVYPEQLTLPQQIDLFSNRQNIFGFAGSAFHNHIFSRQRPRITCITLDKFINTNFLILDTLNASDTRYLYPFDNIENIEISGYICSRKIRDINRFARELLEISSLPARNNIPGLAFADNSLTGSTMIYNANCLPDLAGESYRDTLIKLHHELSPAAYLEIGTLTGGTLALSRSPSIAIDPKFQITSEVIGEKSVCLFYQLESDTFFRDYTPKALLGSALDFTFLDGMHHCEFLLRDFMNAERHSAPFGVIALHDCIPVEIPMTDRTQNGTPPIAPHRGGWWTGDVWRTILALKRHRTDLKILCLDSAPTGLVLISRLDPTSTLLNDRYDSIVNDMLAMDLATMTVAKFMQEVDVTPTAAYHSPGSLAAALRR